MIAAPLAPGPDIDLLAGKIGEGGGFGVEATRHGLQGQE